MDFQKKTPIIPKWFNKKNDIEPVDNQNFKEIALLLKPFFKTEEEWIEWGKRERRRLLNERKRIEHQRSGKN